MNAPTQQDAPASREGSPPTGVLVGAWAWVVIPFSYGVYELVQKLSQLFS